MKPAHLFSVFSAKKNCHAATAQGLNIVHGAYTITRRQVSFAALSVAIAVGSWIWASHASNLLAEQTERSEEIASATKRMKRNLIRQSAQKKLEQSEKQNSAIKYIKKSLQFSWDGLFETLETVSKACKSGVTVVSVTPVRNDSEYVNVNLNVIASNMPVGIFYIEQLKADKRLKSVEIKSQVREDRISQNAVRLQLTAQWDPSVPYERTEKPKLQPKPAAPSITSNQQIPSPKLTNAFVGQPMPAPVHGK